MKINPNQECAICDELSCAQETRLSAALDDSHISNAVLTLSDHFAVIPSVGPLVLGHVLVVTRRHSGNVLATLNQAEADELRGVCEWYSHWAANRIPEGRLLCFEHGSRCSSEKSLCSTNHGHLHLLPLQESEIIAVLSAVRGSPFRFDNFEEICQTVGALQDYVAAFSLVPNQREISGITLDASDVPSQYLRKVVADQLGLAHWDWKVDMNADLLRKTLALGFEQNRRVDLQRVGLDEATALSM